MRPVLQIRNRQKTRPLDLRRFRSVLGHALKNELELTCFELCFHVVGDEEMTSLNETFLQHAGTTDVITFDLRDLESGDALAGEIFICMDEALRQAERYRTSGFSEVVRYAVHGVLHLTGFDDKTPTGRRIMKRRENRLMEKLEKQFALRTTQGKTTRKP